MNKTTQIIIAIVAFVLIGGAFYYIDSNKKLQLDPNYHNKIPVSTSDNSSVSSNRPSAMYDNSRTIDELIPTDWLAYSDSRISFRYPPTWGSAVNQKDTILIGNKVVISEPHEVRNNAGQVETFSEFVSTYNTKGYTKTNITVGGIDGVMISSPQIGDMITIPMKDNLLVQIMVDSKDSAFVRFIQSIKFTN